MRRLTLICLIIGLFTLTEVFLVNVTFAEKITLKYMTRMRAEEFGRESFNNLAKKYEELNPNVKIKFIDITYQRMREQALIKAQAGTPPDITEPVVSWIPQLAAAGILEPIRNYLSQKDLDRYVQAPIMDATYEGVEYGVPFWHGPILLYANKSLLKRAGYPVRGPKDILEFKDMVEKIGSLGTDKQGRKILGFSLRNVKTANSAFWFTPWLWAWGGKLIDIYGRPTLDSVGMRKALEFYQWCTRKGYSAKGMDPYKTRIVFSEGRAGFVYDGPWLRGMLRTITENPNIDEMYKVVLMPKGWDGTNWTIANPTDLVVFKGSKYKEQAFDFVKFVTSNKTILRGLYQNMGLLPTLKEMIAKDPLLQDEFAQTFFKQMPYSRGTPWKSEKWPGLQDILAKALTEAVAGRNVDDIAIEAQKAFEELLTE